MIQEKKMNLRPLARWLAALSLILIACSMYVVFFRSPEERVMGERIRILYVHVGAAWVAYLSYGVTAFGAAMFLARRDRFWDRVAAASAEWGVVLTTITLLSGSLWARSVNGWWWRWDDPRLNLTLILWFLYVGYLILRRALDGEARAAVSAVVAIAGLPAAVLNHFATLLFRTYHPESIMGRPDGPAADDTFVWALVLSLAAYSALYGWLLVERLRLSQVRDLVASVRAGVVSD
jgi:heme exporter protein C